MSKLKKYLSDKFIVLEDIQKNQEIYERIKANLDLLDSLSDSELQIHNNNEGGVAINIDSPSKSEDAVYKKLADAYWRTSGKWLRAPASLLQEKIELLLQKLRDRKMKGREYRHLLETPQRALLEELAAEIRKEHNLSPKGYSSQAMEDAMEACERRAEAIKRATKLDPEKLIRPFTI